MQLRVKIYFFFTYILALKKEIEEKGLVDIYIHRSIYLQKMENIFSNAHWVFSKTDLMLGHKIKFHKNQE